MTQTTKKARFKMEWREGNIPKFRWVNEINKTGEIAHFSPWTNEIKGTSEVIYTHTNSGVWWNSSTKRCEGCGCKPNQSLWVGDIDKKEFTLICDRLDAGESWEEIWDSL